MAFFNKNKQKKQGATPRIQKIDPSKLDELLLNDSQNMSGASPDEMTMPLSMVDQIEDETAATAEHSNSSQNYEGTMEDFIDYESNNDATNLPEITHRSRPTKGRKNNMSEFRLNVARVTSDFDNGEELYRRAQQRINNMMNFVEQAEVDFALLDRLEPENRRLKSQNRTLNADIKTKEHKISVMTADLADQARRTTEVKAQYDVSNANLSKAIKTLADRDRDITQLSTELDGLKLKHDRLVKASEVETRETEVLRDRICTLSDDLEDSKTERMTLNKRVETLRIDCEDLRISKDLLQNESHELRSALDSTLKQNNQLKGEMVVLNEEIATFKTQYEFNIITRDDRIFSLETQMEEAQKQLDLKDEMIGNSNREISDLRKSRTSQELERERLEKAIDSQNQQLEDAHAQIVNSKESIVALDKRYKDVEQTMVHTLERAEKVDKENAGLRELEAEITNLKSELSIKSNLVERCDEQITSLTKQKNNLERTLAVSKDQTETIERKATLEKSEFEAQVSKLEIDLKQKDTDTTAEYQAQITELTNQNTDLQTDLSIAQDRFIRLEEVHEIDTSKHQTQVNDLIGQLEMRHKDDARDASDYEVQIAKLTAENHELEARATQAEHDVEMSAPAQELPNISEYLDEIESLKAQLNERDTAAAMAPLTLENSDAPTLGGTDEVDATKMMVLEAKIDALTVREKELERALAEADTPPLAQNESNNDELLNEYERKIEALTEQLDVKNEVVATAASDVEELRRLQAEQDEQSAALKRQIKGQTLELDNALEELSKSQENMKELDERYRNVASALEDAKQQRESSKPAATPDIAPPPHPDEALTLGAADKVGTGRSQEISLKDRILGYKLGQR